MNASELIQQLNDEQRQALLSVQGPVRIIAGAGSGKTRVIINKIAYLIKYAHIASSRICALTFTNKAANEMKERIVELIGEQGQKAWISTYHALCVRILREDIVQFDYPKTFNILDGVDQDSLLKNIYKEHNYKYDASEIRIVKSKIGGWKNDFVQPSEAIDTSYNEEQRRWAYIYKYYQKRLNDDKNLDFNDLILFVYRLFTEFTTVLEKWQARFDYVLVDEFQDTNDLQFSIVKMLVKNHNNITAVGDPDQTIYSWRGAKVNLILNFHKYFPDTLTVILHRNYRSTQNILSVANTLIANNKARIKKDLISENSLGTLPKIFHATNTQREAGFIAKKIKELINISNYNYDDFLILYRANYLSRDLEQAFVEHSVSYQLIGAFRFFERKEIKDVIALLKMIAFGEQISLLRVLIFLPKIGPKTIEYLQNIASEKKTTILDVILHHHTDLQTSVNNNTKIVRDIFDYVKVHLDTITDVSEFAKAIVDITNYYKNLLDHFEEDRADNILELYNHMKVFSGKNTELSGSDLLVNFLQEITLFAATDDQANKNSVALMTIHNAKGLEKKVVFVVGLNDGILPTIQSIMASEEQIEEERRTFYVAITRAKELLFITYADGFSFITNRERFPSRFLSEINHKSVEWEHEAVSMENVYKNKDSIGFMRKDSSKVKNNEENLNWKVGQIINHSIFGQGTIVKVLNQNLQIAFNAKYGIKVIPGNIASLTKTN